MKKGVPPPPPQKSTEGAFNPKDYTSGGYSQEDVLDIKRAFDLFDTDGGGSVDPKCNSFKSKQN